MASSLPLLLLLLLLLTGPLLTSLVCAVGNGRCAQNITTGLVECKDISYGSSKTNITKSHWTGHGTLFSQEVASYNRIQAVPRPKGCENFLLFPRMLASDKEAKTLTMERFGKPIECAGCCESMCETLPLRGETGLCQQLACIAAVLHLANVVSSTKKAFATSLPRPFWLRITLLFGQCDAHSLSS